MSCPVAWVGGHRARACPSCLRRTWLLRALAGPLDRRALDRERLHAALDLPDRELIDAVAGRRREGVRHAYERLLRDDPLQAWTHDSSPLPTEYDVEHLCPHDPLCPVAVRGAGAAPRVFAVAGGRERLHALAERPVVAIVGARRASDYGVEMAKRLGRGLSTSGVTVVATLEDGVSAAAHAGALQARGDTVALLDTALDMGPPARRRTLLASVLRAGCAIGELPPSCAARRLGAAMAERLLTELSSLMVVVEAGPDGRELAPARRFLEAGERLAAVPGRVTSPLAAGTNALLRDGVSLVRGPEDVLDLLYELSPNRVVHGTSSEPAAPSLEPRLAAMLGRVGAGEDTAERLTAGEGADAEEVLAALSELELLGLLSRGDGGRYVPSDDTFARAHPISRPVPGASL